MGMIQMQAVGLRNLAEKKAGDPELQDELRKAADTIDLLFDVLAGRPYAKPPRHEYNRMEKTFGDLQDMFGGKLTLPRYGLEIRDTFNILEITAKRLLELDAENKNLKKRLEETGHADH